MLSPGGIQYRTMRVITFFNHAGGAAKTTALNIGHTLAGRGQRVLLIDADPQANLTRWLGLDEAEDRSETLYPAVLGDRLGLPTPREAHGLHVIPSMLDLAELEPLLPGQLMGQLRLRQAVRALGGYDFVLIDSPPSLGQLSTLAVLAADELVVPVPAGNKGLEGLSGVTRMVEAFRQAAVPSLRISLLVPTRVATTTISRDSVEALRGAGIGPVSTALIERPSLYPNSQLAGQPVAVYDPKSPAVGEFKAITEQLLGGAHG